jgi:hypothetical protein
MEAKMALADSIEKYLIKSKSKCTLGIILQSLNEEDKNFLLECMYKKNYPTWTLTKALRLEGFKIAEATFQNHRNGKCQCPLTD